MTTNQTPDKNKNPCRSCKKLKRRCLGVYPIPCAYCVQQKKLCKYPEPKGDGFVLYTHSDVKQDHLNDPSFFMGSQQLTPTLQQWPPIVAAPHTEINITCVDGLDSKGVALRSSLLNTDHVSAPLGIDTRPNVRFATGLPYPTRDIYGTVQMSGPLLPSDYDLPQDLSLGEMAPDHAIPESAYDNLNDDEMDTDVPPDDTNEVIDDYPSEDQVGRARATNVYSKEANEAFSAAAQRGHDYFVNHQ